MYTTNGPCAPENNKGWPLLTVSMLPISVYRLINGTEPVQSPDRTDLSPVADTGSQTRNPDWAERAVPPGAASPPEPAAPAADTRARATPSSRSPPSATTDRS